MRRRATTKPGTPKPDTQVSKQQAPGKHPGRKLGLLALSGGAAAVAAEVTFRRKAQSDPAFANFRNPLRGNAARTTSADGTEIYAEIFGADDAPTFVLAPGWTEQLRYFDPITRILVDRGFRVVVYDLRGQGQSGTPQSGDHVLERYGEDLEAVLEATCAGRTDVIVAGHSMGGMSIVAWAGVSTPSSRVRAAALINTGQSALVSESRIIPARIPAGVREAVGVKVVLGGTAPYMPVSNAVLRGLTRYMAFGPDSTAAQIAFYEPMMWEMAPKSRGAAGLALSQMDQLWAVSRLDVPTLVIAGANDRMTPPSHAQQMASELPALTDLVILPRTGHMGPLERSAEIADELCKLAVSVGIDAPGAVTAAAAV